MTGRERVLAVMNRQMPDRVVCCPNIGQWFDYHKAANILPPELADCVHLAEALKRLGFDICSRNLGGDPIFAYRDVEFVKESDGVTRMVTSQGELRMQTLVQQESHTSITSEHWVKSAEDLKIYQAALENAEIHFDTAGYEVVRNQVGEDGIAIVPLLHSPLKMLHVIAGLEDSCYLLMDAPKECEAFFEVYTEKFMRLADECCRSSAEVFMTMDNLDSFSQAPDQLKKYCSPFYHALGDKLRASGKRLFSHACGKLKMICPEIRESRLDGIEGIATPPLGDIQIHEALAISDTFIANGGMTVHTLEKGGADAASRIDNYTRELIASVGPNANRFLYSSGCNTSIFTPVDNLKYWRDATWKYGQL